MPRWCNQKKRQWLLGWAIVTLFIPAVLTACQPKSAARAAIEAVPATPVTTNTKAAPAVVYTVAAPTELPSFALVNPDEVNTIEDGAAETSKATATTSPTLPATEAPSPTPAPTFTPPALPLTSADEHYWLRRPVADGGVVWTDKAYPYGSTRGGTLRPHHGVEFNVPAGTEILAAASGTVRVAGDDGSVAYGPETNFYGNLVVIELDSGFEGQPVYTLYGHLSQVLVSQGQHMDAQEVIAISGASGVADGPHMHFEVRVGQNSYQSTRNPLLWLYPFPDRGTVAGRVVRPGGQPVPEAPVRLRRIDAPSRYAATTTYAGTSVNPDEGWNENFVLDDVEAGYYEVIVASGQEKFKKEIWVFPYQTTFVEMVLTGN